MRTIVVLAAAAATLVTGASAQQAIDHRRPLAPGASVRIHNLVGSVRITGWDRDTIAVTGTVDDPAARFYLAGSGAAAKLGVELPLDQLDARGARLEIRLPARTHVWVKAASADIDVSGITGGLDLYSVTGRIHVAGNPREVHAESMGGDVIIAASAPSIRARSASGSVDFNGTADDAAITTVSGAITVSAARLQRARFESVNGDIAFTGALDRGGSFDFVNHAGAIELRLPADAHADFAISSFHGTIRNELTSARIGARPDMQGREMVFTTGNGGANVSIRTFKGPVVLIRK